MNQFEKKLKEYEKKINQQFRKEQDDFWLFISKLLIFGGTFLGLIYAVINKFF